MLLVSGYIPNRTRTDCSEMKRGRLFLFPCLNNLLSLPGFFYCTLRSLPLSIYVYAISLFISHFPLHSHICMYMYITLQCNCFQHRFRFPIIKNLLFVFPHRWKRSYKLIDVSFSLFFSLFKKFPSNILPLL